MKIVVYSRDGVESSIINLGAGAKNGFCRVYDEDTILDLRHKICIATKIPIYCQHLFTDAYENPFYTIYFDNYVRAHVDSFDLFKPVINRMIELDIPYDVLIYENRDSLRVQMVEHALGVGMMSTREVGVVDMRMFVDPIRNALRANNLLVEYVYFGMIIKYWPIVSLEVFVDYIMEDEEYLETRYPALATDEHTIRIQTEKIAEMYSCGPPAPLNMVINSSILACNQFLTPINLINLFDFYVTTETTPVIKHIGRTMTIQKEFYKKTYNMYIDFPAQFKTPECVIILILTPRDDQIFLCFDERQYQIKTIMNGAKLTSPKIQIELVEKHVNPVLDKINEAIDHISSQRIPRVIQANMFYVSINVTLHWPVYISDTNYKLMLKIFAQYIQCGIFQPVEQIWSVMGSAFSEQALYFVKGPVANARAIDSKTSYFFNYYSFLTNNDIATTWRNVYHGFLIKIAHTQNDVRFDVNNIKGSNYMLLKRYLGAILKLNEKKLTAKSIDTLDTRNVKKLRRLQEYDPNLYIMRGTSAEASNTLYSVICQEPNQPMIYSPDDVSKLPATTKNKLFKYWNFTTESPAFYACPNPKYPHLMFIVNKHPDKYCLPCCKKRPAEHIKKNVEIFEECMASHIYNAKVSVDEVRNKYYIFEYTTSPMAIGRLSNVTHFSDFIGAYSTLKPPAGTIAHVTMGVPQVNMTSKLYGFVQSLMAIVGMPVFTEFIDVLCGSVNKILAERIRVSWLFPERGIIYNENWLYLFTNLMIREFNICPLFVEVRGAELLITSIAATATEHFCFILKKVAETTISYEPIMEYEMTEPRLVTTIWPAGGIKIFDRKPTRVDTCIEFNNIVMGGVAGNKYITPDVVKIGDETTVVGLPEFIRDRKDELKCDLPADSIPNLDVDGKVWAHYSPTHGLLLGSDPAAPKMTATPKKWVYPIMNVLEAFSGRPDTMGRNKYVPQINMANEEEEALEIRASTDAGAHKLPLTRSQAVRQGGLTATDLTVSYYKIYFYEMILIEFIKKLNNARNGEVRAKVLGIIKEAPTNLEQRLKEIFINLNDIKMINIQMGQNKEAFPTVFEATTYNFDRSSKIFTEPIDTQHKIVEKILDEISYETDDGPETIKMDNNYLSYAARKIPIYRAFKYSREEILKMLIKDINNPLKRYMFFNNFKLKRLRTDYHPHALGEIVTFI